MYKKLSMVVVVFALLASCASKPKDIKASYVSEARYQDYSCVDLNKELSKREDALGLASGKQLKVRGKDTLGVLLLGLPVSAITGDNKENKIASLKGHIKSLNSVKVSKSCGKSS